MTRPTNPNRQYVTPAAKADDESGSPVPHATKKPMCYRCRQGIARGEETHLIHVWAAANRPQPVTVCGSCLMR